MEGPSASVKKGAWTEDEDILLKRCIEKYGAGNWHRVPYRAAQPCRHLGIVHCPLSSYLVCSTSPPFHHSHSLSHFPRHIDTAQPE
ncbi:hypothetical protein V6N13_137678 [Hibiscus sabdariffa]